MPEYTPFLFPSRIQTLIQVSVSFESVPLGVTVIQCYVLSPACDVRGNFFFNPLWFHMTHFFTKLCLLSRVGAKKHSGTPIQIPLFVHPVTQYTLHIHSSCAKSYIRIQLLLTADAVSWKSIWCVGLLRKLLVCGAKELISCVTERNRWLDACPQGNRSSLGLQLKAFNKEHHQKDVEKCRCLN